MTKITTRKIKNKINLQSMMSKCSYFMFGITIVLVFYYNSIVEKETSTKPINKKDNNNNNNNKYKKYEIEQKIMIKTMNEQEIMYQQYRGLLNVSICDNKNRKGTCYEYPTKPSPRNLPIWWNVHKTIKQKVKKYNQRRQQQNQQSSILKSRPLIFVGDSITEAWNGTGQGQYKERTEGVPEVLQKIFVNSGKYDPLILAIGGDQTQHLLYRLQHGELVDEDENADEDDVVEDDNNNNNNNNNNYKFRYDNSTIFVILIGTNNLGLGGNLSIETTHGIITVAKYVLDHSNGHILVLELLPRANNNSLKNLCPPRCNKIDKPYTSFLPLINEVNLGLRGDDDGGNNNETTYGIKQLQNIYGKDRIGLTNCNSNFFTNKKIIPNNNKNSSSLVVETNNNNNNLDVDISLMPDLLHPNAKGHEILANCILDYISTIPQP